MKERLQKVLANLGLGSRREIEGWISEGRIRVNGEVAELGCQIDGTETVQLDGRKITIEQENQERRVLIYYKPEGEITTRHDPEGRTTIFDSLPRINNGRWISVGRLDINTQGLLLVTNDGELAHRLMHPSHELEREYAVRVIGDFTDEMADNMRNGIEFEDGVSKFEEILWSGGTGANFWYHVTVKGGKNREVRRLWESQGLMVSRLIRIRYGNVELPKGLREGQFIDIDPDVLKELVESVGLEHQRVTLDEKTERQRTKPRRVSNNQRDRRQSERSSGQDSRRSFGRDDRNNDRRSSDNRGEGRPFERNRSFDRDRNSNDRRNDSGRPFNRDERNNDRRSSDNRGEGRPFERSRSFDRDRSSNDRRNDSGRPFNRDERNNDRRSSDNRGEGRPFERSRSFDRDRNSNDRRNDSGRPFNRDERSNDRRSSDRPRSNDQRRSSNNRSEGRSFGSDNRRNDRDSRR